MTLRLVPQALPSAFLDGTNTYGTFYIFARQYLLFADERQVQHNLQWVGISSNYHQLRNGAVQCFRGFIRPLLDLLEAGALSHQVVDHGAQLFVGEGLGAFG